VLILLWWIRVHVTLPLKRLEDSVKEYAESLQTPRNPDDLLYSPPEIKINNEIKSLSQSISAMSVNIRDYAKKITAVSKEVEGLQGYVSKINNVAYSDPLTRVKNRAAYENACGELIDDIYNMNARFAIVMADVNNLKKINDQYGHDKGNEYIVGVCRILSDIYKRSPIYRVGGDEFVIVLEGKDYDNRDVLRRTANEELMKTACDTTADPWKRYSAAIGMAVYEKGRDMSVEEVFKRADEDMYAVKVKMKAKRE
jgi:diguanylate cyclase (GGDEF)-like protein